MFANYSPIIANILSYTYTSTTLNFELTPVLLLLEVTNRVRLLAFKPDYTILRHLGVTA